MARDITTVEGRSIVTWLEARANQRIDRGECWDAAELGIQSVGAARPGSQLYVWGRAVQSTAVQLGDILQFTNFKMRITQTDKSWVETGFGLPRHTAIVSYLNTDGSVDVLHQNYDNVRSVQLFEWVYLRSGTYGSEKVAVSGTFACYRPRKP